MSRIADVLAVLTARGASLALAESCSGGLLAARITDVPGASRVFRGGWVVYQAELKRRALGLDPDLIRSAGTVSAALTEVLARAALRDARAHVAVAITCSAGPEAEPGSVVGEGYVAIAMGASGDGASPVSRTRRVQASGDRPGIRERMVDEAIDLLHMCVCRSTLLDSTL